MGNPGEKFKLDDTFPIRLRAARLKAGLSLEDLAQKLGGIVTRQAIARYEKGQISPSPEVLSHLLQVLEIPPPPDFPEELPDEIDLEDDSEELYSNYLRERTFCEKAFKTSPSTISLMSVPPVPSEDFLPAPSTRASRLRDKIIQDPLNEAAEEVFLRSETGLPQKQMVAIKITIFEKMKNYLWLEKLLRLEKNYQPPISTRPISLEEAEKAASELRKRWDLGTGAVNNLLAFLEEHGIKTFKLKGPENFESLSGFFEKQPFIAVNEHLVIDRMRFKTATELAHVLFGPGNDLQSIKIYNRFAAAFLLPASTLEEYFLPAGRKIALSELAEIKLRYGVSLQAIMRRALDLGLVTERRFRSFRELMNEKGWLWREPVDYRGEENPSRFRRLLHYAVSSEILDLQAAATLAGVAPEVLEREIGEIF
ncbi:MAG: XRE family transcriptional regulator [Candidatus Saccharicenans sp.]|nr:XRE family transcriptional regulator [Candidatus Saccharicenans sp.]